MTLQYFSAEVNIFGFERNAKSFVLSLCILVIVFPLVVLAFNRALDLCTALIEVGLRAKKRRARSHIMDVELSHPDLLGLEFESYAEKRSNSRD